MEVISAKEKAILRGLASKVNEYAQKDSEKQKEVLWTKHNDLERTRPLLFCSPENGWNEIITQGSLECNNSFARSLEFTLRMELIHAENIKDDKVIDSHFYVEYDFTWPEWGLKEIVHRTAESGAYSWDAPLTDYSMLEKLKFPEISLDYVKGIARKNRVEELFGDILNIHLISQNWWWLSGLTQTFVKLRGLENMMLDMYDYPKEFHSLMKFLLDGTMNMLDNLEKQNLFFGNVGNHYVGSGGFGYTKQLPKSEYKPSKLINSWGSSDSQETSNISGEMFNEFVAPYQKPIMERFGLSCYGCCESLDNRWQYIKDITNLRRVSVSPWANVNKMAEFLGNQYIYSYKPNPTYLAVEKLDEELARKSIKETLVMMKNCHLEIIMKDNHTIGKNPNNLYRFAEIVREEIENAE